MPLITITHHHYYDEQRLQHADFPLLRKMMETIMAQLDDLSALLTTIASDVADHAARMKSLEDQLTQLQQTTPPQVDLSGVIAQATAIRTSLEGTAAAAGGTTTTEPAPAPTTDTSAPASTDTLSQGAPATDTTTVSDTATADVASTQTPA